MFSPQIGNLLSGSPDKSIGNGELLHSPVHSPYIINVTYL